MSKYRTLNKTAKHLNLSGADKTVRQPEMISESLFLPVVLTPEMTADLHILRDMGGEPFYLVRRYFIVWLTISWLLLLLFFVRGWLIVFFLFLCLLGYFLYRRRCCRIKKNLKFYHRTEIPSMNAVNEAAIDQLFSRRYLPAEAVLESLWHTSLNPSWFAIARRIAAIRSCCYNKPLLTPHPEDHFFLYFHCGNVDAEEQFLRIVNEEFGMTLPRDCADDIDNPWTLWQLALWLDNHCKKSAKDSL